MSGEGLRLLKSRPLVILTLTLVSSAPWAAPNTHSAAKYETLAIDTLRQLVEINSVEPAGSRGCVDVIVAQLRSAGLPSAQMQVLAPEEHPEKANLLVRLPGRGAGKPLLWTSHLDVVAADPADWSVSPFKLTQSDGWYYGRGTGDMKGEVAALVAALARLRAEKFAPRHDLVFAFTADEEAAGHVNGVKWLLATHRELLEAGVAFNPDVGGSSMRDGKPLLFGIETAEKTYATYSMSVTNPGGHSSQPGPDNAIYRLSAALLRVGDFHFPVRVTRAARDFLAADAAFEAPEVASDIRAVLSIPPEVGAANRLVERPEINSQLRTTCVATQLNAGSAENALPQRAQATVQCRLLPGDSAPAVLASLQSVIADPLVSVALLRPVVESVPTEPDARVIAAIGTAVRGLWPQVKVMLNLQAGGSDAIFTRGAGIPTYGVSSIFSDMAENRHHGRDERISARAFSEGVEFTYHLIKQVDSELDSKE